MSVTLRLVDTHQPLEPQPYEQVTLWRISCGMEREHLARELGFTEKQVDRLENGTMGLIGRDWVASQLLSLGCPKHVVEALQITPDCQHPTTRIYHSCVEHIDGTWTDTNTIICATCGWIFGEVP